MQSEAKVNVAADDGYEELLDEYGMTDEERGALMQVFQLIEEYQSLLLNVHDALFQLRVRKVSLRILADSNAERRKNLPNYIRRCAGSGARQINKIMDLVENELALTMCPYEAVKALKQRERQIAA